MIEEGLMKRVPESLNEFLRGRTAFWIWDENVWEFWGRRVMEYGWPGPDSGRVILFPALEVNKRLSGIEVLARSLV